MRSRYGRKPSVLRYLLEQRQRSVTTAALLQAVWSDVVVSEAVPRMCIRELRRVLRDVKHPRFIETQPRRGYRWIAPLLSTDAVVREAPASSPRALLVGRERECEQLYAWFRKALAGERQIIFIAGEVGIGKTTLVDAFVAQLATSRDIWIVHGQCIEQYGTGEAYLPLLEALGQLGRRPDGRCLVELLLQQALSWLLQLPALVPPDTFDALQQRASGITRERMLRELAEVIEVLTAEQPLILVLEDLHWSDASTIDWLAYVARRRAPARLLVVGTYRPVEALVSTHPVRTIIQELRVHAIVQSCPWIISRPRKSPLIWRSDFPEPHCQ